LHAFVPDLSARAPSWRRQTDGFGITPLQPRKGKGTFSEVGRFRAGHEAGRQGLSDFGQTLAGGQLLGISRVGADTGERLRPGDEKALRPPERSWLKIQRATQVQMRTVDDAYAKYQMQGDIRERARTINHWGLNTPSWDSRPDPLSFQTDQITRSDVDRAREGLERSLVSQTIMDADLSAVWRGREYDQLAEAGLRTRFLEPLFDPAFVNRITGCGNAELMARASERYGQEAVRALSDQVNTAATGLITELWGDPARLYRGATAMEFQSNSLLMQTEAQRLLSIYGPRIVDQTGFLVEQHRNLCVFAPSLTPTAFERSDLLARVALESTYPRDFEGYDRANVEAVELCVRAQVAQLQADFLRTENPVLAWEAFVIARNCGMEIPDWVWEVVEAAADGITDLREEVERGAPLGKEAEAVGRALGFGKKRPGETGWFAEASQSGRDREMYFAVMEWLESERIKRPSRKPKVTRAYAEVAEKHNSSSSTVGEAYRRMKEFIGTQEEFDE
jgi:hypothetical protein